MNEVVNDIFKCDIIDYKSISEHLPAAIQALYYPKVVDNYTLAEIRDALRIQQLQSKSWLFQHLEKLDRNSKILVVGSWIGFISYCIQKMGFVDVTETDMDEKHKNVSEFLNSKFPKFYHYSKDVNALDLTYYDVIVCTSCEHIADITWYLKAKNGTKLFLQSNNLVHEEHINLVNSAEELHKQYPYVNVEYMGTMIYNDIFSRYMIIGEKI
jgi:hypothetical protein